MRVPQSDRSVLRRGRDFVAIRAESNARIRGPYSAEQRIELCASAPVLAKDMPGEVHCRTGRTVAAGRDADDSVRQSGDRAAEPAPALHVPEEHLAVPSHRYQSAAVRTPSERIDLPDVSAEHLWSLGDMAHVPEPYRGVGAGRGELSPVRAEGDGEDSPRVAGRRLELTQCPAEFLVSDRIEEDRHVARGPGRQHVVNRIETERVHTVLRVDRRTRLLLAGCKAPEKDRGVVSTGGQESAI